MNRISKISWLLWCCHQVGAAHSNRGVSQVRETQSAKKILSKHLKTYKFHHAIRGGSTEEETTTMTGDGDTLQAVGDVDEDSPKKSNQEDKENVTVTAAAADVLEEATTLRQKGKELHDQGDWSDAADVFAQASELLQELPKYLEEYCTCRLHEALCRLKMDDFEACIEVCTSILNMEQDLSGAIRARAYHRRAKAQLHLGNDEEALQDARSAAFLGDRKAVALYGKLYRGIINSEVDTPPALNDILHGKNPFLEPTDSKPKEDVSANSLLLESLLKKSSPMFSGESPSILGQGGAGGSLAKSLLSSLSKRLESESDTICQYLKKADPDQIQRFGTMAGVQISDGQASRLVNFCHSVTPKSLRRTVRYSKRAWYGVTLMRKINKVITKYKIFFIVWALLAWTQSAIRRPIPISRKAANRASAQRKILM